MADYRQDRFGGWGVGERSGVVLCAGALLLLIPLIYAPAINEYRVSDSFHLVGQIDFPATLRYFHQTSGFGRNEYRPVVLLSYAWDNFLWGDRPLGYHLTNIVLHTANGILLLLVFHRLTGSLLLAFSAATLFSVHPSHHSRVAWIAARDGTVCLFFLLLAWLAYLYQRAVPADSAREAGPRPRFSSRFLWGVSGGAFLLALLSYEGAVSFPVVLLGMEMLFNRQAACWPERMRQALRATFPYFFLLVLYVACWLLLFQGKVGGHDLDFTLQGMGRNFYRLHYRLFHHIQHWLGLFYLLAVYLVWRNRKQLRLLLGASLVLLWLGYLPFLPIRGYADRFGFLSAAGLTLLLSLLVSEIALIGKKRFAPGTIFPVLLLLLFVGYYTHSTRRRLQQWVEAGQKAEFMLMQLKALRPSFPPNTTLVFDQIPRMHGNAYVFVTGFRAAVRSRYGQPPARIVYFPTALDSSQQKELLAGEPVFYFRYLPERDQLAEVTARLPQSSRRRSRGRPGKTQPPGPE